MDVVLLFNGLGNQMSQYALYLAKKQHDPDVRCMYFPSKYDDQHNGFELDKIFGIKLSRDFKYLFLYSIFKLYLVKDQNNIIGRFIRKILHFLKVTVIYENIKTHEFNPNILLKGSGLTYFWGGWHCEDYFKEIKAEIFNLYQFKIDGNDSQTAELQCEISKKTSVSIHIRRGDYASIELVNVFGKVCDLVYYNKAIEIIKSRVKDPFFFLFSDDPDWISENFKIKNSVIVDCNKATNSWKDMYLMSRCKHNINANSTFSWWGAWLNSHPDKIVIVPDKFSLMDESQEVYPESWIKIPDR